MACCQALCVLCEGRGRAPQGWGRQLGRLGRTELDVQLHRQLHAQLGWAAWVEGLEASCQEARMLGWSGPIRSVQVVLPLGNAFCAQCARLGMFCAPCLLQRCRLWRALLVKGVNGFCSPACVME